MVYCMHIKYETLSVKTLLGVFKTKNVEFFTKADSGDHYVGTRRGEMSDFPCFVTIFEQL